MGYKLNVKSEDNILRIEVTAHDSYKTSLAFFKKLAEICKIYNCKKILVISISTPLKIMEAYAHSEILKVTGFNFSHQMAWVEIIPRSRDIDGFIEDMLVNRFRMKVFSNESHAKQWLLVDNTS